MVIVKNEYRYPSKTGLADIYSRIWAPEDSSSVKAIFQIAHGMAEHCERYEQFAQVLCESGYAVCINDHIGHGKSVANNDDLGYFGPKGGWNAFIEDARTLTEKAKEQFPNLPYIFFGHSMGSFIAREYALRYGKDELFKGAIFCGTSGKNPAIAAAITMADIVIKTKGERSRSELINKLAFGAYNGKIKPPRTGFDWLTRDDSVVDEYIADEYCGFIFTAAGFKDMFTVLDKVSGKAWYDGIDKTLPMLLISGRMDPVGGYGKGVAQVYNDLRLAGKSDVTIKLYDDARHELLNEINKADVIEDVIAWADKKIKR